MTPEELLARVLHRDGLMLVIDKPAGIAVHRHPRKTDGCLEDYFDVLRYGLPRNPGQITLRRESWTPPDSFVFGEAELKPLRAGEALPWRLVA